MVTKSEEINQIEISVKNREAVINEYAPVSYTHLTLPTILLV